MTTRRLSLLLALVPLAVSRPTESAWRMVETTDDLTSASDRRLILRADQWPGATLVVACGERLPSVDGRSLLFYAGQPLEPFGDELAADLRFDDQPRPWKTFFTLVDYGEPVLTPAGHRSSRQVAFLGTDQSPYFSHPLLDQLLGSGKLSVTYRAFGEMHTAMFHLAGLREALAQLAGCRWTS